MNTIIFAHAEQEFIEAVEYYNVQDIGYEFAIEITNPLAKQISHSLIYSLTPFIPGNGFTKMPCP